MDMDVGLVVSDCADLAVGHQINAWQGGRLVHRGTITDLLPEMGLFWIRDEALYERRLLDMCEVRVTRAVPPAPQEPETSAA